MGSVTQRKAQRISFPVPLGLALLSRTKFDRHVHRRDKFTSGALVARIQQACFTDSACGA